MEDTKTLALVAEVERLRSEDSAELSLAHKTIALQGDEIERLTKELAEAKQDAERYRELLYAVESKFPNETRHETALRYIRLSERHDAGPAMLRTDAGAVT